MAKCEISRKLILSHNQSKDEMFMLECNKLKQVDNFKYLGDWVWASEKGKGIRIVQAWGTKSPKSSENKFLSIHSGKCALLYNVESLILTKNV